MAGMAVDGLVSGLDTTSLINQLLQAEAAPQAALKTRLSVAQASASAYRSVNTRIAAIQSAAEALLKPETWTTKKATSSASSVTVTVGSTTPPGSLSFTVEKLATSHALVKQDAAWTSTTSAAGFSSLDVYAADGSTRKGTITLGDADGDGVSTVTDAAAAINASSYDLSAAVVQTGSTSYALQVTSKKSGADNVFSLTGGGAFTINTQGQNAELKIGTTAPYTVTSATNAFTTVLPGGTITVSTEQKTTPVTVTVNNDPDAIASKMQGLVDAINSALSGIKTNTDPKGGAAAILKGDSALRTLAGRLLDAVSSAVGLDGSPGAAGLQLNKDGTVAFDKSKFLTALASDPVKTQRIFAGGPASNGPDALPSTADDIVPGVAQRLLDHAKAATNTTTGTLTMLATGRDKLAADFKTRIEAWDARLVLRKQSLSRQFSAMETALSSLKSQSNWLSGQLASLPSS